MVKKPSHAIVPLKEDKGGCEKIGTTVKRVTRTGLKKARQVITSPDRKCQKRENLEGFVF